MLVVAQSVTVGEQAFVHYFPLATNGRYVQLGDYREFVRGHDIRRRTSWEFTVTADTSDYLNLVTRRRLPFLESPSTPVQYSIQVAAENKGEEVVTSAVALTMPEQKASFVRNADGHVWKLQGRPISLSDRESRPFPRNDVGLSQLSIWRGEDDETDSPKTLMMDLNAFANTVLRQHFLRLRHAPPYREIPQRVYIATPTPTPTSEDLASQARALLRRTGPAAFVRTWLTNFGMARDLDTNRLVEGLLVLRLTDATTSVRSNLADFGFGTSQLLPLLIDLAEATSPPNSRPLSVTHVIQQPEVHLHPAAQSILGDLFADVVSRGRQLIVETHSEHLIYRVQRLVAEERLDSRDVAVHYVDKDEAGSKVTSIELARGGTFVGHDGLPPGFLDTGLNEALAFQKALRRAVQ